MHLAAILFGVCLPALGHAQPSTVIAPLFHGALELRPAAGRIDPSGNATLTLRGWTVRPTADSNGIFPSAEPILVAIGENTFRIESGDLNEVRQGVFIYRADRSVRRGVRVMRLRVRGDGSYALNLSLNGVELSRLALQDPACVPTAIVVGDDDAFAGLSFTRRSFRARRLRVRETCQPTEDWTWLERCGLDQPGC